MAKTTFDTNPVLLQTLLKTCDGGELQLGLVSLSTGQPITMSSVANEEGEEIPTSKAQNSGLHLIEVD